MTILDDIVKIKKLDSKNVLGSMELLSAQIKQAWKEVAAISFPKSYYQVNKIVLSGMGGSALGAYVLKSLYNYKLNVPFEIVNDYHLPAFVDKQTLVILSTYSGTTEETLSCAEDARLKKAQITGLTTGKNLAQFLKSNNYPGLIYNPVNNPSGQPRLGTGYSIASLLGIFHKLGFLKVSNREIENAVSRIQDGNKKYTLTIDLINNPAKQLAKKLFQKMPVIITAGHLTNTGRVFRNQIHETAKSAASWYDLPELNHHLLESLSNPKKSEEDVKFIIIDSDLYPERIIQRIKITKQVINKNKLEYFTFKPQDKDKLAQVFEVISYGAYVSFYLAMLNGVDPSKIPWVDYFKNELTKF